MKPQSTAGTVYVVDDDDAVRSTLSSFIRATGIDVETFKSAREFLKKALPTAPACLVLDVKMPGLSGLDLQQELGRGERQLPIIFMTGHGDIPMSVRAMKAGAAEFLTKPFDDEALLHAIHGALENDRKTLAARKELGLLRARYARLSPREKQVMALVVKGLLNKQVGDELGTVESTIKLHRSRVMEKMEAGSLAQLVRMADRLESH